MKLNAIIYYKKKLIFQKIYKKKVIKKLKNMNKI